MLAEGAGVNGQAAMEQVETAVVVMVEAAVMAQQILEEAAVVEAAEQLVDQV